MLRCPKCKSPLIKVDKTYQCIHNHCYDIAKSGYVNLVLGNQKMSGDSQEMVKARTLFLEEGYYQPLANELMKILETIQPNCVVDAGCGEGYYTRQLHSAIQASEMIGFDLSKFAVNEASKKDKKTTYAIGSIFDMPIADKSVDCIVNIFAPTPTKEFKRILKLDGYLIKVGPAPDHLMELKEILYEEVYENEVDLLEDKNLTLIDSKRVMNPIKIMNNLAIYSLFMMTPYYWKTSKEAADKLKSRDELLVSTAFVIDVYQLKTEK